MGDDMMTTLRSKILAAIEDPTIEDIRVSNKVIQAALDMVPYLGDARSNWDGGKVYYIQDSPVEMGSLAEKTPGTDKVHCVVIVNTNTWFLAGTISTMGQLFSSVLQPVTASDQPRPVICVVAVGSTRHVGLERILRVPTDSANNSLDEGDQMPSAVRETNQLARIGIGSIPSKVTEAAKEALAAGKNVVMFDADLAREVLRETGTDARIMSFASHRTSINDMSARLPVLRDRGHVIWVNAYNMDSLLPIPNIGLVVSTKVQLMIFAENIQAQANTWCLDRRLANLQQAYASSTPSSKLLVTYAADNITEATRDRVWAINSDIYTAAFKLVRLFSHGHEAAFCLPIGLVDTAVWFNTVSRLVVIGACERGPSGKVGLTEKGRLAQTLRTSCSALAKNVRAACMVADIKLRGRRMSPIAKEIALLMGVLSGGEWLTIKPAFYEQSHKNLTGPTAQRIGRGHLWLLVANWSTISVRGPDGVPHVTINEKVHTQITTQLPRVRDRIGMQAFDDAKWRKTRSLLDEDVEAIDRRLVSNWPFDLVMGGGESVGPSLVSSTIEVALSPCTTIKGDDDSLRELAYMDEQAETWLGIAMRVNENAGKYEAANITAVSITTLSYMEQKLGVEDLGEVLHNK
ncbi:hypothetical protein B0T16DRAFT_449894 [Cercophora newfieldiana]|uniref:Uncharacterized protein n=1 Tax=Cercophora newfieldiana TaxID=92897 RepID=A0AA40CJ66_9PEZI|nr:hypothetical protein B0T16DRAFT_449894 [Cercophora newfieldiana]